MALDDPNPANPIAREVARLVEGYGKNVAAHVEQLGYFPDSIMHAKPSSAIEGIAMELTTQVIRESMANEE